LTIQLAKNSTLGGKFRCRAGFVKGHGFSQAAKDMRKIWALAPATFVFSSLAGHRGVADSLDGPHSARQKPCPVIKRGCNRVFPQPLVPPAQDVSMDEANYFVMVLAFARDSS
jgi:hypothetical protein